MTDQDHELTVIVDIGTNVTVEDGTVAPTSAVIAVLGEPSLDDDVLADRCVAASLQDLLAAISAHFDWLEMRTGRPVMAAIRYLQSRDLWRAVVAEHELTIIDSRIVEMPLEDE